MCIVIWINNYAMHFEIFQFTRTQMHFIDNMVFKFWATNLQCMDQITFHCNECSFELLLKKNSIFQFFYKKIFDGSKLAILRWRLVSTRNKFGYKLLFFSFPERWKNWSCRKIFGILLNILFFLLKKWYAAPICV